MEVRRARESTRFGSIWVLCMNLSVFDVRLSEACSDANSVEGFEKALERHWQLVNTSMI